MAMQGRPLAWDAVMFLDVRWRKLIYSFSDKLLSFYLNAMADGRYTSVAGESAAVEYVASGLVLAVWLPSLHPLPHR